MKDGIIYKRVVLKGNGKAINPISCSIWGGCSGH